MTGQRPGIVCIDCRQPCSYNAYRCKSCAQRERGMWRHANGRFQIGRTPEQIAANNAATAARFAQERQERIDIIEEDLDLGIEPDRIAAGFGVKRDSLGRFLDRAGRHDLAAHFYVTSRTSNNFSKGRTCINCERPCSNQATFCRNCANAQRARERFARCAA